MEQTKNIIAPRVVGALRKKGENLIWTCMKVCLKCGAEKPFSEYHAKRGKPQPQCKSCRSEYMKTHYLKNKDRVNEANKAWYEKNKSAVSEKMKRDYAEDPEKYIFARKRHKYGLTKERYLEILESQENKCCLCQRIFENEVKPHIDHCHETNIIRGILCAQCNTKFGLFKEDEAIFERAIAYAKKYKK